MGLLHVLMWIPEQFLLDVKYLCCGLCCSYWCEVSEQFLLDVKYICCGLYCTYWCEVSGQFIESNQYHISRNKTQDSWRLVGYCFHDCCPSCCCWLNHCCHLTHLGHGWRIGWVDAFRPQGHGFDSRSGCHVGTLWQVLYLQLPVRFSVKLRHSVRAVSGAPLSSSGLEEVL